MSLFPASVKSKRTTNPIRNIVDNLKPPASHELPMINLALGDPTVHGNLKCPVVLLDAVKESLLHNSGDGYSASTGMVSARKSIAAFSHPGADRKITEDDIIITSGCSGAIEVVLSAVLDEGDNVLVPRPGFPLYQVVTESIGASVNFYDLKPNKNWECDLASIASVINDRTKAIVVTNPSNPCGSNYSKAHLEEIVARQGEELKRLR